MNTENETKVKKYALISGILFIIFSILSFRFLYLVLLFSENIICRVIFKLSVAAAGLPFIYAAVKNSSKKVCLIVAVIQIIASGIILWWSCSYEASFFLFVYDFVYDKRVIGSFLAFICCGGFSHGLLGFFIILAFSQKGEKFRNLKKPLFFAPAVISALFQLILLYHYIYYKKQFYFTPHEDLVRTVIRYLVFFTISDIAFVFAGLWLYSIVAEIKNNDAKETEKQNQQQSLQDFYNKCLEYGINGDNPSDLRIIAETVGLSEYQTDEQLKKLYLEAQMIYKNLK